MLVESSLLPRRLVSTIDPERGEAIDMDNWTLHHLDEDFSESADLRTQHPEILQTLVDAFDKAAWENLVYPLDNRDRFQKFADVSPAAREAANQPRRFLAGMQTTHREDIIPLIDDRSFHLTVRFNYRAADEGVLWALGDPIGGMVMYIENGYVHFHYNGFGDQTSLAPFALSAGDHSITLEYEALGNRTGRGRLLMDDVEQVGWTDLSPTLTFGIFEGLDLGINRRGPVLRELYQRHGAFAYSGTVRDLRVVPFSTSFL